MITLEKMAESNSYAKQILELSEKGIIQPKFFDNRFFSNVIQLDEDIYITCSVFDRAGNEYGLVFQYEFETEVVSFVVGGTIDNTPADIISFVPVLSS